MSQSLCKIYLHVVFHIKMNSPEIRDCDLKRVHAYLGGMVNQTGCQAIIVGGIGNHVHILCMLSRTENIAHLVEEIKRKSSYWIKTLDDYYATFAWQGGYAAFSVSQSVVERTTKYIENQREHHKQKTFDEEYIGFLKLYHIDYDERYVFTD